MNLRFITIFKIIPLVAAAAQLRVADPVGLAQQAREIALLDRAQAQVLLGEAVAIYDKQGAKTSEAASAKLLLAMVLYPGLAKNKEALETRVEPLARQALEIRRGDPDTKSADMALALEFESMVLEAAGRLEDSRPLKAKAREIRDQVIIAMQPPAEDIMRPYHLGGPEVTPPRLTARGEDPRLTFEAKLVGVLPNVMAEVIIGADGMMHQIEIFRPAGFGLDEEAVQALLKWKFLPAKKDGVPVAVEGNLSIRFLP